MSFVEVIALLQAEAEAIIENPVQRITAGAGAWPDKPCQQEAAL